MSCYSSLQSNTVKIMLPREQIICFDFVKVEILQTSVEEDHVKHFTTAIKWTDLLATAFCLLFLINNVRAFS